MKAMPLFTAAALWLAAMAHAVTLPAGTVVYGELDEMVTSKKKDSDVGEVVRARVWRDVVVDGAVVIKAGTPMVVQVADVKRAKVVGRKGDIELAAISTAAVDGAEVLLQGGYDKSGKNRTAGAVVLGAVAAWPLVFIKGKQAKLEEGTIFDATVQTTVEVGLPAEVTQVQVESASGFSAVVLYDETPEDAKDARIPLHITHCGGTIETPQIVSLNGAAITPVPLEEVQMRAGPQCAEATALIPLKELSKHFRHGINRFEIESGSVRAEVVLEVEV
jgi:hypothetical protein